jgi:hypothetical protein
LLIASTFSFVSTQAKCTQKEHDDYDEPNEINQFVHVILHPSDLPVKRFMTGFLFEPDSAQKI